MSQKYYSLLTKVGADKLANATALGTQLKITTMAVGDGGGKLPMPDINSKLINEKRRGAINRLWVDPNNPNYIIAEQIIPEQDGGWWVREIGLFDDNGDLVAIGNCPETYKPQLQEGSGRTQIIRMILVVSSTAAVTLKIDPSVVLATHEFVTESIDSAIQKSEKKAKETYQPKGNYQPTGNYALKGDSYTKAESDTNYQPKGSYQAAGYGYSKSESDGKYQLKGNYAPAGNYALKGDSYTKAESDTNYQPKGSYQAAGYGYSKAESDGKYQIKGNYAPAGNYALKGDSYTKAESDGRYQVKGNYQAAGYGYSKAESDGKYQPKGNNYGSKNTASKAVNGWWQCGDTGIMNVWMTADAGSGQTVKTVNFPKGFPNQCLNASIAWSQTPGQMDYPCRIVSYDKNSVKFVADGVSKVSITAIGF